MTRDPESGAVARLRRRRAKAVAGAFGLLLVATGLGLIVVNLAGQPADGTDANGMLALSCALMAVFCVLAAITLLIVRLRKPAEWELRSAAWYPDPTGRAAMRYWDGTDWTEHTA